MASLRHPCIVSYIGACLVSWGGGLAATSGPLERVTVPLGSAASVGRQTRALRSVGHPKR